MTTWSETNALTARRNSEQDAQSAASARLAYADAYTRARRTGATKEQAHEAGVAAQTAHAAPTVEVVEPARTALAAVPAPRTSGIVCTEGSCLHARPGTPCDCTSCFGADHGAKSSLPAAACKGTKVLVERNLDGPGYVYPRCPGCADCTHPRLVLVGATS